MRSKVKSGVKGYIRGAVPTGILVCTAPAVRGGFFEERSEYVLSKADYRW